ncbi:hypothetical protein PHMEG_00039941 [Phytophthora megakarya]|uniref:Uncharacterized protein n=1 Tax=Phytophthora megakarya TaxID=4795 RepID=A0A225UEV9_9STRA|nr:hypothetical protein PHMEG_00039941 [Phytophthora megakarya]
MKDSPSTLWTMLLVMVILKLFAGCTTIGMRVVRGGRFKGLRVQVIYSGCIACSGKTKFYFGGCDVLCCRSSTMGHLKVLQLFATNTYFSDPQYMTPIMVNAVKIRKLVIIEWLVRCGHEVRTEDKMWIKDPTDLMTIMFEGSERSVPDIREIIWRHGDIRVNLCHGYSKTVASKL